MSIFLTKLITEEIDSKFARIALPFWYDSDLLGQTIEVPVGFVCDYESVPLIKGTSKRGGVIHDYLCRKDSKPVVTKKIAADVYLEAMECRDRMLGVDSKWSRIVKRKIKFWAVLVASGYFHKFNVFSTYDSIVRR